MTHPSTREDLNRPCTVYTGPNEKHDGKLVGITYEAEPTCDVATKAGVLKSVPARQVRMG